METKICVFEENKITFELSKDNNMMINATEMAKVFDKKVENFTRIESTQDFIKSCLKFATKEENKTLKSVLSEVKTAEDLIISRQKSGTFMHRILALKFAAWLNSDFEVWVYATIEKLIFGKHLSREKSLETTISYQKEMKKLVDKVEKTGEDFKRYMEIEKLLGYEKSVRANLTKEVVHEMNDMFENLDED